MYATYSPEDNKLRLYTAHRLSNEEYALVKSQGFIWAAKQQLFVAPMWTPSREDFLIDLCGEIEDEDTTLVDRAEQRAERFGGYQENRANDAERAYNAAGSIAQRFEGGQPILVGHHSEKKARKDKERIENNMRQAVQMWRTSEYWERRAKGALHHAKYKELPAVRARRIKKIEADKRAQERSKVEAEKWLELWSTPDLTAEQALQIASRCWLHLPRKEGDREDFTGNPTAYDALTGNYSSLYAPRTLEEVIEAARRVYPRTIANCDRWIEHYNLRLMYEKTMLDEQGASDLLAKPERPKQLPLLNYRQEKFEIENRWNKGQIETWTQIEMTSAEYKKIYDDWKGTREIDGTHRVRIAINCRGGIRSEAVVFLTDSKVHEKPEPAEKKEPVLPPPPRPTGWKPREKTEQEKKFEAVEDALKAGVKVVVAPQLFPTPAPLAARMVEEANIQPGDRILEPSAGTGRILEGIRTTAIRASVTAVEIETNLLDYIKSLANTAYCADFLTCPKLGEFDKILMNPPFKDGADIKHILHAREMLAPGGRLVAICAGGPRQKAALEPLADYWEELPEGTFAESGTNVNTVLLIIEAEAETPVLVTEPTPEPVKTKTGKRPKPTQYAFDVFPDPLQYSLF